MRLLLGLLALSLAQAQNDRTHRIAELEKELAAHIRLLTDWGGLTVYGSLNTELKPAPGRVVFLGDEITLNWKPFFPGSPYLNRGIARQATAQMLVRFRQDVISLKPAAVIIQGGLNDFAGFAGPATVGTISENIMSMAELARANHIRVILASLTPAGPHIARGRILGMNSWLKDYAAKQGLVYLDFYSALTEPGTLDGQIPTAAGYASLAPLTEHAIQAALK